jgi:hypothetical protein
MTVQELQKALADAITRGLPSDTTVVIEQDGWYTILKDTIDPSHPKSEYDMWFTLFLQEGDEGQADCRFTPGGMP